MKEKTFLIMRLLIVSSLFSGCATFDKAKRADQLNYDLAMLKKTMEKLKKDNDAEMDRLKSEKEQDIERIRKEKDDEISRLQREKQLEVKKTEEMKNKELTELEKAKIELEKKLQDEISAYQAKLKMTERGLVVTFLSEIFFDSGKDKMKTEGEITLKKVALILNKNVPNSNIAVEGHTDNDPIRASGWKSNWELSSARALAVVHYFIDKERVSPERLSVVGYGEYKPVKSNETAEGRKQNRRVEIVILPSNLQKVKN